MDKFRKRKDITPVQSEPKKQAQTQGSSVISTITSSLASMMNSKSRNQSGASNLSFISTSSKTEEESTAIRDTRPTSSKRIVIDENDLGGIKAGKMRNTIEVEVLLIDGDEMKTLISQEDAYNYICVKSLGLKKSEVFGCQIYMREHPIVQIRLRVTKDVDKFPPNFSYTKNTCSEDGKVTKNKVVCRVLGVRDPNIAIFREPRERPAEDPNGPWTRWVKLEGMGFDFKKENLETWLKYFGCLQSEFERDVVKIRELFPDDDCTDDNEPGFVTLATGKLSVKMEIVEPIPQYLPAWGKKIRVYYRGIEKLCNNCYETTHMKRDCTNERVSWIEYVSMFQQAYPKIEKKDYGRWNNTLTAWTQTKNDE